MPRLDNTSAKVIEFFDLDFDPNDPGKTEPVDICSDCFEHAFNGSEDLTIAHPPYEEVDHDCFCCHIFLSEEDN